MSRSARSPRGPARGFRCRTLLVLLACLWAVGAAAEPPRGDPAARLVSGGFGGEYTDLVTLLDDGRLIFAVTGVYNMGWGDHHAGVLGLIVSPGGDVTRFSRTEDAGHWKLEDDGRRIDLRSIVLDQSTPGARFRVAKDELHLDLDVQPGGRAGAADAIAGTACPMDLLDLNGETRGSLWRTGMAGPVALHGRSAITHRWMDRLEVDCVLRRVEVFVLDPAWGIYFDEVLSPDGRVGRWLEITKDGRVVQEGPPTSARLDWRRDADGLPVLHGLRFQAAGVSARVEVGSLRATFDPFQGVPGALRRLLELKMQPSVMLRAATAELSAGAASGAPGTWRGPALAKISWLRKPEPATGTVAGSGG